MALRYSTFLVGTVGCMGVAATCTFAGTGPSTLPSRLPLALGSLG